jgi:hypothetical protein
MAGERRSAGSGYTGTKTQRKVRTQVAVLPDQLRRNVSLTVHVELSRKQAA